jgi:hypothetical protein
MTRPRHNLGPIRAGRRLFRWPLPARVMERVLGCGVFVPSGALFKSLKGAGEVEQADDGGERLGELLEKARALGLAGHGRGRHPPGRARWRRPNGRRNGWRCRSALSSIRSRPDSTRRRAATEVITLVIDWIRMIAAARMGRPSSDATPMATISTSSRHSSSATAPWMVPVSTWRTSRFSSALVAQLTLLQRPDRPTDSGPGWFTGFGRGRHRWRSQRR